MLTSALYPIVEFCPPEVFAAILARDTVLACVLRLRLTQSSLRERNSPAGADG